MFSAHGWIRIRSSRKAFVEGISYDNIDAMDEKVERADNQLWDELEEHLSIYGNKPKPSKPDGLDIEICDIGLSMIKWTFYRHLNYEHGMLNLYTARNHKCNEFFKLVEWIAAKGPGSYGIIYMHDDEDLELENYFQVLRILKGKVEIFKDQLLSPIMPVIQDIDFQN